MSAQMERARTTTIDPAAPVPADRKKAVAWIFAAFGFLIAGLVGGTAFYGWKAEIAWIVPVICFAGYLLAFRRGMLLWNPDVDRTWRQYLWIRPADPDSSYSSTAIMNPTAPASDTLPPKLRVVR